MEGREIMYFSERVENLSEQEAKRALKYLVEAMEKTLHCEKCPSKCNPTTIAICKHKILDEALMEGGGV